GGQTLLRGALGAHQVPGLLLALSDERVRTRDALLEPPTSPDQTRLRLTIAGEDEILFFGEHLAVVPGLRWEVLRDDFPGNVASGRARGPGAAVSTNDYLSPRLGVRGEVGYGLTLLGNASRSVRPPNLFELFGNRGFIHGNPNLSAETSLAWDIGFRLAVPGQGTWLQAAGLAYADFDGQVDDLIQLVVTSPGVSVPQNIGSATLRGHELNARVRLWDRLGLIGNYTHQDTRDDGGKDNTYLGKELPGRPADEAYVR